MSVLIGSVVYALSIIYGISQMKKLGKFLTLYNDPDMKKHDAKVMFNSMLKYFGILFLLPFFTFGIFSYPMIPVWLLVFYFASHYIRLWKYHKYSVAFLICMSGAVILVSVILSPFIRYGITFVVTEVWRLLWT